jgi:hypothetical protein
MLSYFEFWKSAMESQELKNECFQGKNKSQNCENEILNLEERKIIYLN